MADMTETRLAAMEALKRQFHRLLHTLWTRAVGTPDYVKPDWGELDAIKTAYASFTDDAIAEIRRLQVENEELDAWNGAADEAIQIALGHLATAQAEVARLTEERAHAKEELRMALDQITEERRLSCELVKNHSGDRAALATLRKAATTLYLIGRWTCATVPPLRQVALWTNLRDALGLPVGTATAHGVQMDALGLPDTEATK